MSEQLEKLAELEHDQWIAWSKDIAKTGLPLERLERWLRLWGPYNTLTEPEKDQDREWARKVLDIVGEAEPPEVAFVREMVAIADADTDCEQCKYHYHKDGYGLCVVHEACDDVAMAWEAWQAAQKEPADACGVTATPPPLGSLAAVLDDSEGIAL